MITLPSLPRLDQITAFVRHRATRMLGGDDALPRAARSLVGLAGGDRGRLVGEHARTLRRLDGGEQVGLDELLPIISRQLAAADATAAGGRHRTAATLADRALRLAYHPSTHYGPLGSPLMLETDRFLAPLRASVVARALLMDEDPRPGTVRAHAPAVHAAVGRGRQRVLVLCASSWTFVDRVVADLRAHTDLEIRIADLSALPLAERPSHDLVIRMRERWNRARELRTVPAALDADLRWADTAIVEWGSHPFAWFSLLDLEVFGVRTLARIHRYEILTPYPLLARSAAFDEIAFVAPTVRSFEEATSPRLVQAGALRDVQNVHDLGPFIEAADAPAHERDPFAILQIGWAAPIKGVDFSLEIIARLREIDERFTLRLVGPTLERSARSRGASWSHEVLARIDELDDGVVELGFRADVPELIAEAGFLVSSSRAEGTHESVAEAAAGLCVPIVRDWPEMAPWGGAASVYPADWIVHDVEEAVDSILVLARDPAARAAEARRRRELVMAARDPSIIREQYLELLRG